MAVFAADSALMRVLGRIGDLIVLNLLFVATSLPLVTLGASLTALSSTAMRILRGRCQSVSADYLAAFRANLRSGTMLLAALLGLGAVFAAWYLVVTAGVQDPLPRLVLLAIWFVGALQLTMTVLFAFPYLATFEDTTTRVLKNSLLMSWRHTLTAFTVLIIAALPVVISVFYPKAVGYGLLWFVIGFAVIAVVNGILFVRIFDRYIPASTSTSDTEKDDPAHALP